MNTNNINITKQGQEIVNELFEAGTNNIFDGSLSYSFTPSKDTQNSCFNSWYIDFSNYTSTTVNLTFRIQVDISYSGFDSSSTAGTFSMWWQGDNYNISNASSVWAGTNYATSALNSQQGLTNLVNGKTGTYTYNTTFTIPASWFQTYSKSRLGVRSDYSNGTGNLKISNVRVYLEQDCFNGNFKINADKNAIANTFYEY